MQDTEQLRTGGILIIPSLNPGDDFIDLIDHFRTEFEDIIVVDDGSNGEGARVFEKLKNAAQSGVHVLTHAKNMGKGEALKTAMRYYLASDLPKKYQGVVTCDSDGQHRLEDVRIINEALKANDTNVIHMGVRDLTSDVMPPRSKFGNKWSAFLFRSLYGIDISDTQTGLRGFSNDIIEIMTKVRGKRFEYEMKVLIDSKKHHIDICEHSIETHYEKDHKSTFKTFRDSTRVLIVLLGGMIKFILAASVAGIVDIGIFYGLFTFVCEPHIANKPLALLIPTVSARIVSSIANFAVNRYVTFNKKNMSKTSLPKYYALWTVQLGASYGLLFLFSFIFPSSWEVLIKLIVDLFLALVSYQVQLKWVFCSTHFKTDRYERRQQRLALKEQKKNNKPKE